MRYLAELLTRPGQIIPALTLASAGAAAPGPGRHDLLDEEARASYNARAQELTVGRGQQRSRAGRTAPIGVRCPGRPAHDGDRSRRPSSVLRRRRRTRPKLGTKCRDGGCVVDPPGHAYHRADSIRPPGTLLCRVRSGNDRCHRSGGELDAQALHVWTVRDGKITRYRGFADTYALRSAVADVASLPPAPVGQAEQHKAATGLVFDVWNSGNLELLDQVVASDVIHHDRYDPNAADGLDGMKATIQRERETFPDLNITVEDQIADEDRVTTRWTAAMTHQRTLSGEPPTGRAVTLPGITIDRFEDGKIVEAWRSRDTLHLLRQIGAVTRTTS